MLRLYIWTRHKYIWPWITIKFTGAKDNQIISLSMNFIVWKKWYHSLEGRKMTCFICYSSGRENPWNLKATSTYLSSPTLSSPQGALLSHSLHPCAGCSRGLPRLYSRKAVSHSLCWLVEGGKLLSRCWLKGPRSQCLHFSSSLVGLW